jgi:hypothetical protein
MTLRSRLSGSFRSRRAGQLRNLIDSLAQSGTRLRILDIGGRIEYWDQIGRAFLHQRNVTITVLNLLDTELDVMETDPIFERAIGDGCDLNFDDGEFDLAHSNSVIEHVVTWRNMKALAAETRRVAKSYYVQTPYFWFPIDPHFYAFPMFHWLPRPIRARLLDILPLATAGRIRGVDKSFETVEECQLLDGRQFRFLFPDAHHHFERFWGLPKSMIAIRLGESGTSRK